MAIISGYGVDLSKLSFNYDNIKRLVEKYLPDEAENLQLNISENGLSVHEWIEYYQNDMGDYGLPALLADIISHEEDLPHLSVRDSDEKCIYLPTDTPWNFNEKEKALSARGLENIFHKYIDQITNDPIVCKAMEFQIEDWD